MSRVERKRTEARRRLIEAGGELIAEHGVEGLRLREIAERADIGFGSFYTHFASKEELVEAVVAERLGTLAGTILGELSDEPDPACVAAAAHLAFIRVAFDDPQLARLAVELDHADAVLETAAHAPLAEILAGGHASGRFTVADVDVAVSFVVGATIAVMRGIVEGRLDRAAAVASARTLLQTFGVPPGEAERIATSRAQEPAARGRA